MDLKAAVAKFFTEAWNEGNFASLDEHMAADLAVHDETGMPAFQGRDGFKQLIGLYRAAFPDVKFTVEILLQDGNHAVARWTATGTNTGPMMGMPPTGKHVTTRGANIYRFEGAQAVETWGHWDNLAFLQQLGLAPKLG